jgi:hypothetical protein
MKSQTRRRRNSGPLIKIPGRNIFTHGLTENKIKEFYNVIDSIRNRKIQQMRQIMPRNLWPQ